MLRICAYIGFHSITNHSETRLLETTISLARDSGLTSPSSGLGWLGSSQPGFVHVAGVSWPVDGHQVVWDGLIHKQVCESDTLGDRVTWRCVSHQASEYSGIQGSWDSGSEFTGPFCCILSVNASHRTSPDSRGGKRTPLDKKSCKVCGRVCNPP